MGHLVGKDVFAKLGEKLDGLGSAVRAVNNERLYRILKELFTAEEAWLVTRMPNNPSPLKRLVQVTGLAVGELERMLPPLCSKGLVMDLSSRAGVLYMPSHFVFGFFEFTMMRVGENLPFPTWAKLFRDYLYGDNSFYQVNFADGQQMAFGRALPHETTVAGITDDNYAEILDYESASHIIEGSEMAAIGLCSCRHERLHSDEKTCDSPLDTCMSFGPVASYIIRNGFGRQVSIAEAKDSIARARDIGLVLIGDNVRRNVSFICQCCQCCCSVLAGIRRFGYLNCVMSSTYEIQVNQACIGCGACVTHCPSDALSVETTPQGDKRLRIDVARCLGCGVCATRCPQQALSLAKSDKRVYHPEDIIERALISNIERGTLHNFIFDNPNSLAHAFFRLITKAFLRLPPVKQSLMQGVLHSRFLEFARARSPLPELGQIMHRIET